MPEKVNVNPAVPLACIILAAGRGTRVGAQHKVLFPVIGVPVINHSIAAYRACGIGTIVVVIGPDGGQIMNAVASQHDDVLFARQREPLGTGDAVRAGFQPLAALGFDGNIICAVGDKLVRPEAVRELLRVFSDQGADAAITMTEQPGMHNASRVLLDDRGRVLLDDRGNVESIVEKPGPSKRIAQSPPYMNESLYIFRAAALARALPLLRPQPSGDGYLTDIVEALRICGPPMRIVPVLLTDPDWVLGYNTPAEFLALGEKARVWLG